MAGFRHCHSPLAVASYSYGPTGSLRRVRIAVVQMKGGHAMQDISPLDHTIPSPPASNGHTAGQVTVVSRATGPRSENGKAIVSQNAVRHGLFSTNPVVRGLESADE